MGDFIKLKKMPAKKKIAVLSSNPSETIGKITASIPTLLYTGDTLDNFIELAQNSSKIRNDSITVKAIIFVFTTTENLDNEKLKKAITLAVGLCLPLIAVFETVNDLGIFEMFDEVIDFRTYPDNALTMKH